MDLIIDPEFKSNIPALSADEYRILEENILTEGRIRDPLVVWQGILVDGHNRYQIIKKHPDISFQINEIQFANRYEALSWICKNQLGRRNLTPEHRKCLIAQRYEAEKAAWGGDRKSEKKSSVQNGHLISPMKTVEKIAKESGVAVTSVKRCVQFKKGIDLADAAVPGLRAKILNREITPPHKEIERIAVAPPSERKGLALRLLTIPKKRPIHLDNESENLAIPAANLAAADASESQKQYVIIELTDACNSFRKRIEECIAENKKSLSSDEAKSSVVKLISDLEIFFQKIKEDIYGTVR